MRRIFFIFILSSAVCMPLVAAFFYIDIAQYARGEIADTKETKAYDEARMLFVGDIMLARHVETLMKRHGAEYPFQGVSSNLAQYDSVVGNFEASVPQEHVHTPDFTFQFSVKETYLAALREAGVTTISLANNHAYDYGQKGYEHTKAACKKASLVCFGHPGRVSEIDVQRMLLGDTPIVLIAINDTVAGVSKSEIAALLEAYSDTGAYLFAYIHWGDEYEGLHNTQQEALAHYLIDNGVDGVIGHHPHVVQDIEIYKDRPIFYSLGNFIFDQYFEDAVQHGLGIEMLETAEGLAFDLVPFTSIDTKSQPYVMSETEKASFLNSIPGAAEIQGYTMQK